MADVWAGLLRIPLAPGFVLQGGGLIPTSSLASSLKDARLGTGVSPSPARVTVLCQK
jgi:hypothetical protein